MNFFFQCWGVNPGSCVCWATFLLSYIPNLWTLNSRLWKFLIGKIKLWFSLRFYPLYKFIWRVDCQTGKLLIQVLILTWQIKIREIKTFCVQASSQINNKRAHWGNAQVSVKLGGGQWTAPGEKPGLSLVWLTSYLQRQQELFLHKEQPNPISYTGQVFNC